MAGKPLGQRPSGEFRLNYPSDFIPNPPDDPALAHLARKNLIFPVGPDQAGSRLDKFVALMTGLSRGSVRDLIDFGAVWVQGRVCRQQSRELLTAEKVTFQAPSYGPVKFYQADPARILYQDEWLLAYNKEANIPCQQTPYDGYNHVFAALKRLPGIDYLALHHRLDSPTSGVMIFARHPRANQGLSHAFKHGPILKTYLAAVQGAPPSETFIVDRPIAKQKGSYYCPPDGYGKPSRTEFTVLYRSQERSVIQARPLTGRTHQIRLHLLAAGHPIIGDNEYGGRPAARLMLHALAIEFDHPVTKQKITIAARRPEDEEFSY